MSFMKLIKEKGSKKIKELKELRYEDPFDVSIDDDNYCDSAVIDAKEIIPPGDDGFGDDEKEGIMTN